MGPTWRAEAPDDALADALAAVPVAVEDPEAIEVLEPEAEPVLEPEEELVLEPAALEVMVAFMGMTTFSYLSQTALGASGQLSAMQTDSRTGPWAGTTTAGGAHL